MERIHYRISLDMFDTVSQKTIKAKRGDTACDVNITLTENGKVYQIADGCYATFSAKKPDGNFILNSETCYIKDNTIVYEFTEQTTVCEGIVDCEVILYGADGNQLTSPRFTLLVGGTVYNGEEIISSDETDALKETVEIAERFKDVKTADFIPAGPNEKAVEYANDAYNAYGYIDANGRYRQFSTDFGKDARDAVMYEPIPDYNIPMGMTIGDVPGGRNVLVNSGISVESLNPQMKLIASGTTTEEVASIVITETNDNGTVRPINVTERISVFMTIPKTSGTGYAYLQVNPEPTSDGTIVAAHSGVSASNTTYVRFDAFYCGNGMWSAYAFAATGGTAWGNPGTRPLNMDFPKGEVVHEIVLKAQYPFPTGTKYLVCGIEV